MGGAEDELQFDPTGPDDAVPLDGKKEEVGFSQILCRIPTDPELPQNSLVGEETSRRSKMVCTLLPRHLSQKEPIPHGNAETEIRFHRVLRGFREYKPSGFGQEMVWKGALDFDKFERIQRKGRATQGAWSPVGKRSRVFGHHTSENKVSLLPGKKISLNQRVYIVVDNGNLTLMQVVGRLLRQAKRGRDTAGALSLLPSS